MQKQTAQLQHLFVLSKWKSHGKPAREENIINLAKVTHQRYNRDSLAVTHVGSGKRQRRPTVSRRAGDPPQLHGKKEPAGGRGCSRMTCSRAQPTKTVKNESSAKFPDMKSIDKIPFLFKHWYSLNIHLSEYSAARGTLPVDYLGRCCSGKLGRAPWNSPTICANYFKS